MNITFRFALILASRMKCCIWYGIKINFGLKYKILTNKIYALTFRGFAAELQMSLKISGGMLLVFVNHLKMLQMRK